MKSKMHLQNFQNQQLELDFGIQFFPNLMVYLPCQKCETLIRFARSLSKNIQFQEHDDGIYFFHLYHQHQNVLSIQEIVSPPLLWGYKFYDVILQM